MSNLISRDNLLCEIRKKQFDTRYDIELTIDTVKNAPTIDVVPAVHGEWIGSYDGYADGYPVYDMWECSNCGFDADGADEKPDWRYCPNCGAKMKETV